MGSPPTLDPGPTRPPDPHRQADAGDSELLEHLQTPVAFGGHEFGDWPVDQIAGGFGDDLDARHRHDHTAWPPSSLTPAPSSPATRSARANAPSIG